MSEEMIDDVVARLEARCSRAEDEYPRLAAPDGTVAVPFADLRALLSAYNPNERLREALEAIIALTDRPDISDGGKVIFIRRNAGPQGEDT